MEKSKKNECHLCGHHDEICDICRVDGMYIKCKKNIRNCPWKIYPWKDAYGTTKRK